MNTATDISRALADRAEAFCRSWLPAGRKIGNYWIVGNKHGDPGRSLVIRLTPSAGRQPGKWVDHATGEHGDLLDILEERLASPSWGDVFSEARRFLGRPDPVPSLRRANRQSPSVSDRPTAARKLLAIGRPVHSTLAERYLRLRGIARFGSALRYHHAVYYRDGADRTRQLPALLAAITDNDGQVTGCARTWLDPATARVAAIAEPKRLIGHLAGNAVRFYHGPAGGELVAGEGIETMLSIGTAFPVVDICACLTATHLGQFIPPPHLKRLWIARDNDDAGERAATLLRQRAEALGIAVFDLVPQRNDFNDDLRADGLTALRVRLRTAFENARCGTRARAWK
ncbi:DUF7146 domain-containing protein [Sinorhizobium meliloti]|uniref:Uncharacterized protein n=1 Tax=Rhizobium meliloti TaxID=382 RepID=A0A2J0YWY7_RHIML|nr:toprim domain-containing protein [Sinorhizobium meliloti]PJR12783.1 hypothetical protein CEJ86_24695 [Sinorhizobium meliloti]